MVLPWALLLDASRSMALPRAWLPWAAGKTRWNRERLLWFCPGKFEDTSVWRLAATVCGFIHVVAFEVGISWRNSFSYPLHSECVHLCAVSVQGRRSVHAYGSHHSIDSYNSIQCIHDMACQCRGISVYTRKTWPTRCVHCSLHLWTEAVRQSRQPNCRAHLGLSTTNASN
jgi:hypothetical protein